MSESHDDIVVDEVKRRDGSKAKKDKKDKKDKGYMIFEEEESAEELFGDSLPKTQRKLKKTKSFKFSKKEKKEQSEKKKQGEKEKKVGKESKKDEKAKWKKKILPKSGESTAIEPEEQKSVFGVPLALAVERNPSHDGILLPAVVRECIDYISEYGLACEGIYRVSGVKSKVTQLKEAYNVGTTVYLVDHEPSVVASLLKLFLRELPEPVLTSKLMPKFEQASVTKNIKQRVEQFCQLIQELPPVNKTLLSWVIVHMTHVIEKEKFNKMSLQNVSIVLSPTMKISHRVLNVLFTYSSIFFKNTTIKKYIPPLKPATSRWALDLPECPSALEEELKKQESLLKHMHEELMRVKDHRKEEELWEVQRIVTQLNRKLKHLRQMEQAPTKSEISLDKKQSFSSQKSWSHTQHEHHESNPKLPSEFSALDSSAKNQDKAEHSNLTDLSRVESAVRLRSREHLRSSEKKHLTPEIHSRKKVLHTEGFARRHSSNISDKNVRPDKGDSRSTTMGKGVSVNSVVESKPESDFREEKGSENFKEIVETKVEDPEKLVADKVDSSRDVSLESVEDKSESSLQKQDVGNDDSKEETKADEPVCEDESGVDRKASSESVALDGQSVKSDATSEPDHTEVVLPYKTLDGDASDSSNPYTDVAEDDDQDRGSSSLRGGDECDDDNSYEVLGDEESQSPWPSEMPAGFESSPRLSTHSEHDSTFADSSADSVTSEDAELGDHAEFDLLLEEYSRLVMEEEELLAVGDELRQKIETERDEIERLHQDISELQMMRHDDAFETSSSSSSSSSDSSFSLDDDLTNEDLKDILSKSVDDNKKLEKDNAELCEKIHQERMACLGVKVQNRMIQQKQLCANADLIDFE